MATDQTPEDSLNKIEVTVLSLVLTRISLRGRLLVESDLQQLEKLVGELPEVRAQINHLFGVDPTPALPAIAGSEAPVRRPPGRPRKDRDDAASGGA